VDWRAADWWREIDGHYAHLSVERDGLIAYTPSAEHGIADRQVRMAPGRYLRRYFPELPAHTITRLSLTLQAAEYQLSYAIAHTADEIEAAYRAAHLGSCMAHPPSNYNGEYPVRAYAGDFAVATMSADGHGVVARAVINPRLRRFVRVYGEPVFADALTAWLCEQGYDLADGWDGGKLARLPHGDLFVAPYLDGDCQTANDMGDHLLIAHDGDLALTHTNGLALPNPNREDDDCYDDDDDDEDRVECDGCGAEVSPDDTTTVEVMNGHGRFRSQQTWCGCCVDSSAMICEGSGDWWRAGDMVELYDGTFWSPTHFRAHGFTAVNGLHYPTALHPDMTGEPLPVPPPAPCPAPLELPFLPMPT
jgi:hypothetical protein